MSFEDNISWFHGKISRIEAEKVLRDCADDGCFLVRESTSALGDYVLSLYHSNEIIHYQIRRHGEDAFFSIDDGPIIHGLEMLIEFYKKEPDGLSNTLGNACKGKPPPADCRIHGRTNLLHRATREGDFKIVSELLKSGYRNIDAKNTEGQTALHVASILGNNDMIQCLLDAGANVGIRDSKGLTPMHYACQENQYIIIRTLVDKGNANVQARASHNGWVALHEASSRGYTDCVKALLAMNAPCRPRTDNEETPYDLAMQNGHLECANLLENYEVPPAKAVRSNWFHRNISRDEACKALLENNSNDGSYLVRCSSRKSGVYVLTMVFNKHVYHFEIEEKGKMWCIDDGPYLESLEHLIDHYTRLSDGLPSKLKDCLSPGMLPSLAVNNPLSCERGPKFSRLSKSDNKNNAKNHRFSNTDVEYIHKDALDLSDVLGEGEFGSVLKGVWKGQVDVAVKILRNEHIKAARDSFLREASVMIDLNHPHIVKLLGICLGPPIMMVQELVALGSLLDCLLDYPHSITTEYHLKLWSTQIASGMMYLEQKRFVHRDLAARNILLSSLEETKISDFGLSRALGSGNEYYRASQGGRWPIKWYAPESVNFGTFSHASDVWSYGILLWEMYSFAKTPYGDMSGKEVIEFIEDNKRLHCPTNCLESIYDIMLQCWRYNPDERLSFKCLYQFFSSEQKPGTLETCC